MGNRNLDGDSNMSWMLILICVSLNNPNDVPGIITMIHKSQEDCEKSLSTMTYWLKFNSFKIDGKCVKNY